MEKILVINPGSTSTKIAVYEDAEKLFVTSIEHSNEEIEKYDAIYDQYEFRKNLILGELEKNGVKASDLTCIMSRGGLLPPVPAGAIRVNQDMCDQLRLHPVNEHASNLGAPIAYSISQENGIPAFVYDPVTVDEMIPVAKFTGIPEMRRRSLGHNLNMRAMAHRYAEEAGRRFEDVTVITAHMGGGTTIGIYQGGKSVDIVNDEAGCGLLVTYDDPDSMAGAMKRFLEDPDFTAQCRANALRTIEEKFEVHKMAKVTYGVYEKALHD